MSQSRRPSPRKLPGSLEDQPPARPLAAGSTRNGTVTVLPGKVEIGQGILTALVADRRRRARRGARAHPARADRHVATAPTKASPRAAARSRKAASRCATPRRKRASCCSTRAAAKLGVSLEQLSVERRHRHRARAAAASPTGSSPTTTCSRARRAATRAQAAALHTVIGATLPRLDIPAQGDRRAGFVHDLELPGMLHGRVVRPPELRRAPARARRGRSARHARRGRRRARRQLSGRRRGARGAGDPRARPHPAHRAVGRAARRCPIRWIRASCSRSRAPRTKSISEKRGRRGVGARGHARLAGRIHASVHRARLARAVVRGRLLRTATATGSGRTARASTRCAATSRGRSAWPKEKIVVIAHGRRRLLRPQRRGRRRVRRGAARARACPGGRCACSGCARTNSRGSRTARRWWCGSRRSSTRGGNIVELEPRPVEQRPHHAPRAAERGGKPARGVASRASRVASRAPAQSAAAGRRQPPQRDSALRVSRTSASPTISSRARRCASRRCARSARTPTCSRSSRSWTSSREAAGADPVEFRLRHLKDPRARAVIETVAAERRLAARARRATARAAAASASRATRTSAVYVAVIVEVEVAEEVTVKRAWAAVDAGQVDQSRRRHQPDRRRHHPDDELDAEGAGPLRPRAHRHPQLGRLSDPHVRRGAASRGDAHRPARSCRRSAPGKARAGTDRGGDRQCDLQRDRRAAARHAVHARAGARRSRVMSGSAR